MLQCPSRSPDLNLTEMPRRDLKSPAHEQTPSNLKELKQHRTEERAKLPPQQSERLIHVIAVKGGSANY